MISIDGLLADARAVFGWTGAIDVAPGPRGALGQIWRLEVDGVHYALKHIVDEPPTEAAIRTELDLVRRVGGPGLRIPASHPGRDGRYLGTVTDGTWFRCYDWVDLQPIDTTDPAAAQRLGALLARLHRRAPAASGEPNGGGPADPWYHQPPAWREFDELARCGATWAATLRASLPQLYAQVEQPDPARLLLCHRDLHPENVFLDTDADLVVVDWDDLGPADPGRELARALFDWWCSNARTDLDSVRATVRSYLEAGGPGRITGPADFSMLVAGRLNFLVEQARLALAHDTDPDRRAWAQLEVATGLDLLPTPAQLADVLEAVGECQG